jgi:hypothetical protein
LFCFGADLVRGKPKRQGPRRSAHRIPLAAPPSCAAPAGQTTAVFIVGAVVLLAILTDLSFRYLETPMRQRGKRVARDFLQAETAPQLKAAAAEPIAEFPTCLLVLT